MNPGRSEVIPNPSSLPRAGRHGVTDVSIHYLISNQKKKPVEKHDEGEQKRHSQPKQE
jgi:hypothetical protein